MCLGYAYAQLNKDQHTKYCTAGDDSITESHTMENGVCKYCGYAPAKTYSVTVTDGSADHSTNVAPGTKVTLTANTAPSGQEFDKWAGNVTVASDTTFTMPASAVKIEATYKDAPPSHTHSYGTEWKYDGTNHWHKCECGDKADTAAHSFQWVIDKAATKEATKPFSALYRQHRGSVLVKDVNGAEGPAVDCQRFPVLLGRIATSVIIGVRLRDNGLRQTIADESLYPRPGMIFGPFCSPVCSLIATLPVNLPPTLSNSFSDPIYEGIGFPFPAHPPNGSAPHAYAGRIFPAASGLFASLPSYDVRRWLPDFPNCRSAERFPYRPWDSNTD